MKLLLNVNLYLKVFLFNMLSAWVKHQIVDIININIQGFSSSQKFCFMGRFPMGSKFYFSQWKAGFSWFIAKYLKFVIISHSLCYIWSVKNLVLCKLPILFSTVKFKLGYNFSQFRHGCKIGICERWP